MTLPRIALSLGDPNGIGPEVTAKALATLPREGWTPVVHGSRAVWAHTLATLGLKDPLSAWGGFESCDDTQVGALTPGEATRVGGRASLQALAAATRALREGRVDGLCTAPLAKAAVRLVDPSFVGHTEYLQQAFGLARVVMLMSSPGLDVALATTHVALRRVADLLTVEGLVEVFDLTARALERRLGRRPRLAVLGLNPHAGEDGAFGDEELRVIGPAIARAAREGLDVHGPFAADGLFARWDGAGFDGVVAMFHDQGLVAFKQRAFHDGVNVTLGLPRPRTSPDHGTAWDLAGRGVADARSMASALSLCVRLARG